MKRGSGAGERSSIAIIGLAGIFPGAATVAEYFRNVLRQRCFVRELPVSAWETEVFLAMERTVPLTTTTRLGAIITDDVSDPDLAEFKIPPAVLRQMSRNQKLALVCARRALADAGYLARPFNRERAGVVMAAAAGELVETSMEAVLARRLRARMESLASDCAERAAVASLWDRLDAAHPPATINEDTLPGQIGSLVAGRIASVFDLHGFNETIDSACASSLAALARGMASLRLGDCDLVIAGGVDTDMTAHAYVQFSKVGALSTNGSFPFDARADGFVMGEGCGIVVLKRFADAVRDGDQIHAVIHGWGASSDGAGKGITAPSSAGQIRALRRAYEDAGISPADLHYLECHGTGTVVGDAAELASVGLLLSGSTGGRSGRARALPIGSAKSMVGHLKLAAGMAGLFRAILAVSCRVVPPQVNFEEPNRSLDWVTSGLTVPRRTEALPAEGALYAGVSSFGFGGTNHHIVISSPPQHAAAPIVDANAFVDPSLPGLACDTCLLFPGQGSQYPGMLAGLSKDPLIRDLVTRAEPVCRAADCASVIEMILASEPHVPAVDARLRDTRFAQPALFIASAILVEKLRHCGVNYGMAIGHSLGELSAVHAAGLLSFEEGLRVVIERGRLMAEHTGDDPGRMAVLSCGRECAEEIVAATTTTSNVVVCANFNSYSQTVVSGTTTAVSAVVEFASERGVLAVGLPVSRAFHSPLLRSCVGPLAAAVATTHPCWPRVPAIANRGREVHPFTADGNAVGRPLSESQRDRFIDLISGQAVRPVDFVAQIELAYAAGIRRFVEVGPRGILVGLVDDMLQGKPFRAVTLDPNGDRASSLTARLAQLPEILEAPLAIPRRAPAADRRVRPRESGRPRPQQTSGNSGGLRDVVRQIVAAVSGYAMDDIADDAEFERDLGIDTLKIFEIITRLSGTVLPERFARLREASSVRRILEIAAADAFRNDAVETRRSVDRALACYRFEPVVRPPRSGLSPARRYQFIAGSRLTTCGIDVSGIGQLVDPNATDAIIALPLPASAEALCRHTIPELVHRVAALAERASHADAIPEVVVLTFAAVDDFHAAGHRAITAAVKSLQKDARRIALSHAHIDTPQREGTALKSLLGDPGFGRRLRHDGMIEDGCILRHELHGTGSATLATVLGPDDVVLVTGGARGIASLVVRHLVALVPARFLLVGRRPGRERWIDAEGVGRVEYLAADVRDPAAVARLGLAGRGITLVIHGAGIVRSRPLASLESSDIEEVMGTKVLGLHHVLTGLDLERLAGIVCFSSAAGYAGGDGHPDYAAANAYLDGFSCASTPVLSIGWSAWDGAGMATDERTRRFLSMSGIELIPAARGVRVFAGLLGDFLQNRTPRTDNYIVHAGMAATCFLPRDTTSQALATTSEEDAENGPFRVVPLPARLLTPLDDLAAVNALLLAVVEPPAALAIGDVGLLALGTTSADSFASSRVEWLYTPAERGEIDIAGSRKRQCEKRVGKFAVKMLTTEWLRRRHGVNVEPRAIEVLAGGPPRITVPGDPHADMLVQGLSCSLSHTENLVCAALATRPVGVDVERSRHLDAAVVSRLGGASDADAIGTFTRKEAVLKAAGVGIGSGLDDVVLAPDDDGDALYLGARYRVTACADAGYAWALAIQTVSACSQGGPRRQEVPVAPGQEALWFLEQLGANGGALAFGWTQRVQGPFDSAALELALQNVVERHDALRTVFTSAGGRCRAEVINDVPLPFVKVDLGSLAIPAAKDEADRRCRDECMRPFDIAVGPLFRFLLLRLASDDHMLCCVFHHLVMDVSSALVFRVELAAAYRVLAAGGVPRPPALALQYSDHAARHLARLTPARIDELVAGWRAVLADRPPQLGLTGDAPTSLSKRGTVGSIAVDLPPHVFRGLAKAAADAGVTLFSAFFAVFAMVYARLSGSDDVVVGTPFAGRTDPDTLPLIGYFISMLPLRLDLAVVGDGDPSFREILPVARDAVLDAVSRHDLPFHLLVERLDPTRAGGTRNGGSSLFRSVLRFFHESSADAALMPGERTFEELPAVGTLYDLSLIVVAGTDAARCRVEYDAGIFTSASAARIGRQFASAFAAVAMDPDCRLSSVPLGDDHARIISAACDSVGPARRPDDRCIEDLFAVQAARTPSAVAITGPSATLTYKQLDEAANRLAHVLVRVGVKPGAVVGLLLDRSVAMVVGMLATLRAGAAYMPLDPAYPPDRLAFMVADSTAAAIVTLGRHTDRLPAPGREGVPRVCLDRDAATLRAAPAGLSRPHPTEPPADRRLACVLYTSGSSGTPKGVAVTHGGIVRLFPDAGGESRTPQGGDTHYVRLKDDDVLLHLSPPSFDASTFEIWGALLNGGRCVVMEEKLPDLQGLGELVVRHRISVLWLTTPLFNAVVDHAPELLRGVRHVLTGGEAASVRHVRRARALFPHLRLTNCYGPTECTTFACTYDVPRHLDDELYSIPIGHPIAHTTVRLVDRRGRAVAPGAVGELVLGGAGVALGYVNRPEQTAERFSVEPPAVLKDVDRRAAVERGGNDESPSPVGRLYRTGDLARLLPDGTLDFVGRLDDQVKVRGHRVEPGEVEAALRRHAGVRDAAVVMAADAAGQGRLVAFLVPVVGQLDDGASHRLCLDLEAELRRELPPYLVPDAMVVRAELPCTPHGKVDRRRLASEAPLSGSPRPAVRPTNPTEAHIAQIWAELLGLPAVGMADDFFALGGTSLSAVVMVSRVEHILGRRVPLAVLFADPTVAGVARALVEPVVTADDGPLIQLGVRRDVSTVFFLHGDLLGGGLYCRALARELDEVVSLVAIHPHGLAGQPEHSSIEAMASAHAEVIRRMQPVGPYRLGGYCNGALEAFEIAKQLVANGEEVSFVALVAPPAIEQATTASAADVPNGGERSTLLRRCAAACAAYRPTFIPVPIVLVQATDDCPTGGDPAGGWRSLSPSVTVDVVQGTHATAVAIHAAAIGARIRERLAAFDGGDSDQARDPTES